MTTAFDMISAIEDRCKSVVIGMKNLNYIDVHL